MSGTHLCGVNCARLAHRYTAAVIGNARARVADLPELQNHRVYKNLSEEKKAVVRSHIRLLTQQNLIKEGYNAQTVARVLEGT